MGLESALPRALPPIAIGLFLAIPASAAPEPRWDVELQPMVLYLHGSGNDVDAGSETVRVFDGATFGSPSVTGDLEQDFGDSEWTLRGEAQRRRDDEWGFGLMGWWFDTDDSQSAAPVGNAFRNPFLDSTGNTLAGVSVPSLRSVTPASGIAGLFEDGQTNELTFRAKADLDIWKVELHGLRKWVDEPNRNIDILFGLELANLDTGRRETVTNNIPRVADPVVGSDRVITQHHSDADHGLAFGPMLGLQGERRWGAHRLRGLLMQSLLFADLDSDARVTRTVQTVGADGSVLSSVKSTIGKSSNDGSTVLPVTELKLQYAYDVNDDTSLGIGGFLSVWWDADLAPTFARKRDETLVFLGLFLSAQMRFH